MGHLRLLASPLAWPRAAAPSACGHWPQKPPWPVARGRWSRSLCGVCLCGPVRRPRRLAALGRKSRRGPLPVAGGLGLCLGSAYPSRHPRRELVAVTQSRNGLFLRRLLSWLWRFPAAAGTHVNSALHNGAFHAGPRVFYCWLGARMERPIM